MLTDPRTTRARLRPHDPPRTMLRQHPHQQERLGHQPRQSEPQIPLRQLGGQRGRRIRRHPPRRAWQAP